MSRVKSDTKTLNDHMHPAHKATQILCDEEGKEFMRNQAHHSTEKSGAKCADDNPRPSLFFLLRLKRSPPKPIPSHMPKKTLLFAMDALHGGGAEKVLVDILNRLERGKFDIHLFLFTKCGIHLANIPEDVQLHYLFKDPEEYRGLEKSLRLALRSAVIRLLKRLPFLFGWFFRVPRTYDVGVSFCEGINMLLFSGVPQKFKRRISWIHTDVGRHKFVLNKHDIGRAIPGFNTIVFVSRSAREIFLKEFPGVPAEKLTAIYNPISVEKILRQSEEKCDFPGAGPGRLCVVSAGRFSAVKRFDRLILACKQLLDEGVPLDLFILGFGAEQGALEGLIHRLGVGAHVRLLPFQENPYAWMRRADVFASSSDYEGMPLVVTEAMILGLPIVATRTSGSTELLQDGEYGLLVDFNPEALHTGLAQMLRSLEEREKYRKRLDLARKNHLFPFRSSLEAIEQLLSFPEQS
jgi:glycosyltransferase involved in cell wall biosynthesis